jgi:tetratricopeptide (TPR) repeat protein
MTLSDDSDHELKSVFEYMINQYGDGERNLLSLGAVLYDMGKFNEAEKCYRRILDDEIDDNHVITVVLSKMATMIQVLSGIINYLKSIRKHKR